MNLIKKLSYLKYKILPFLFLACSSSKPMITTLNYDVEKMDMYKLAEHRKAQLQILCDHFEHSKRYSKMPGVFETCYPSRSQTAQYAYNEDIINNQLYLIHDLLTSKEISIAKSFRFLWVNLKSFDHTTANYLKEFDGEALILSLDHLSLEIAKTLSSLQIDGLFVHTKDLTSVEVAKVLAQFRGKHLSYSSEKKISSQIIQAFSQFKGKRLHVQINGQLSIEDAEKLNEFKGDSLTISNLKILTIDLANTLKKSRIHLIFNHLEDFVLEALVALRPKLNSNYMHDPFIRYIASKKQVNAEWLDLIEKLRPRLDQYTLSGIKELSIELINILIDRKPKYLNFNGLQTLSKEAAQALSRYPKLKLLDGTHKTKYRIELNSLEPTEEVLAELVKTRANELELGFNTLNLSRADILSRYRGDLFLPNIQHIDPKLLKALFSKRLHGLTLTKVNSIDYDTEKQINAITKGGRKSIRFQNLRKKDKKIFKERVATSPLEDFFSDKSQIDIGLAEVLVASLKKRNLKDASLYHVEKLDLKLAKLINGLGPLERIYLRRLREISSDVLKALLDDLSLERLELGVETLSSDQAKILFTHTIKDLKLNNLRSLTAENAQYISHFSGEKLTFDQLRSLSPKTAQGLSQFKGKLLRLNHIIHLTADVAAELAKAQVQTIELKQLHYMDHASIQHLATFKGKSIIVGNRSNWSKEQQKLFQRTPIRTY